ncbi:MAG: Cytochrome c [Pedosphaera sp.]|nr:Cytochrome c [Pedosphaera sp.]
MLKLACFICIWILAVFQVGAEQKLPLLHGLIATASDDTRHIAFLTPTANFTLTREQSIHPQLKPNFKAEWNGFLTIERTSKYTITGDARVFIDDKEIRGQTIQLESGEHAIRVTYERKTDQARLQLQWQSDSFKKEPIPSRAFGHREEPQEYTLQEKIARGRELVEELNCIACHKSNFKFLLGRRGPELSGIGSQVNSNWIYHWLENPRHFRASAVMPILLETAKERADVSAYLAALQQPEEAIKKPAAGRTRIAQGKESFETIGCIACHGDQSISLKGMGSKMTADHLGKYLEDPIAHDSSGRMPNMGLTLDGAFKIADYLVLSKNRAFESPAPTGNSKNGKALVTSRGCLNCHTINENKVTVESTLVAMPLDKLNGSQGCLVEQPEKGLPQYKLTKGDRENIAAFLQSPDISEAPVQDFHRLVNKFNCTACHALNEPAKIAFDPAPPALTDAGNKLRASWLDEVLNKQKRIRPWMKLRMPHFGQHNTASLVNHFAAQAGAEFGEGESIPQPILEQIQNGSKLIGKGQGGLSCIMCHDFRGEKSGGELRGPDMTEMYARIRTDWLRRWLRDPARIQPGTAMPSFFSDMPEAKGEEMINQLTQVLWAGRNMPIPEGLSDEAQAYLLLVKDEPILLRTFMPDSSPRSIAVGLPGNQSYCFDAQTCQLRYAWTGDFLDVKPVWAGRGGAKANILGNKYFTASDIFPIRIGNPDKEPVVKFRGYKLVNKVPEFMYDVDGVLVREQITCAPQSKGLVRAFELGPVNGDVWFFAGNPAGVTVSCSTGEVAGERIKIPDGKLVRFTVTVLAK